MVEVFKTNVKNAEEARMLVARIEEEFDYRANFDLEDCDRILRVECTEGIIQSTTLIHLLKGLGFNAEVLEDPFPDEIINSEKI